jgi:hypothetical protein
MRGTRDIGEMRVRLDKIGDEFRTITVMPKANGTYILTDTRGLEEVCSTVPSAICNTADLSLSRGPPVRAEWTYYARRAAVDATEWRRYDLIF